MQNAKEDAGHRQWINVERWLQYKGLRHTNVQGLVVMVGAEDDYTLVAKLLLAEDDIVIKACE